MKRILLLSKKMGIQKILFMLMFLSFFVTACEIKNTDFENEYEQDPRNLVNYGVEKMDKKDFQGAIKCFTEALEIDKNLGILDILDVVVLLAKAKQSAKDHQGALETINEALNIKNDKQFYVIRAEIQDSLGNLEEALNDIKKAISMNEKGGWPYFVMSEINFKMGNNQEALLSINKSLSAEDSTQINKIFYYLQRARVKYAVDDTKGALKDINDALKISEDNSMQELKMECYKLRSEIQDGMGDKED